MNKLLIGAALASLATPTLANENFTGFRVGATAGIQDIQNAEDFNTDEAVYGVDVGVDIALGDTVTFGVEAFSDNPLDTDRTIGVAARVGYAVSDRFLPFVRAGYTNYRIIEENGTDFTLDGLVVGAGLEYAISDNSYARVEYRYSDFEQNIGNHNALVGVGLRF